jgi:hypothetical protein
MYEAMLGVTTEPESRYNVLTINRLFGIQKMKQLVDEAYRVYYRTKVIVVIWT